MANRHFSLKQTSLLYAAKTLLGAILCWYGLAWFGVTNPLWAIISVIIVSDADFSGTMTLAKTRVVNTAVGCTVALISLILFRYSPWTCYLTAAATVLFITSINFYPANWRLAPVTVVIVMDAARQVPSEKMEILYALERGKEIIFGCAVALVLAYIFSRLTLMRSKPVVSASSNSTLTGTGE
jgi:uncharacterized membrane protein YccC